MLSSLCLSTSAFAAPSSSSPCRRDPSPPPTYYHQRDASSAPLPIGAHLEENGMQRASPLSSSAESLCSVRSSCSTRSAAEREAERRERRRLLDLSIAKIQGPNQPLRRHLLVYNAVKTLQRDLECLDEEELYVSLMETPQAVDAAMEVDHWLAVSEQALSKAPAALLDPAEQQAEEPAMDDASSDGSLDEEETRWAAAWQNEDNSTARRPYHQAASDAWHWPSSTAGSRSFWDAPSPQSSRVDDWSWGLLRSSLHSPAASRAPSDAYDDDLLGEWSAWGEGAGFDCGVAPILTHELFGYMLAPAQA